MEQACSWQDFLIRAGDPHLEKMMRFIAQVAAKFTFLQEADKKELGGVLAEHVFEQLLNDSYPKDPQAWPAWVWIVAHRRACRWIARQRQASIEQPCEEWTLDDLLYQGSSPWLISEVPDSYIQMLENLQYLDADVLPSLGPQQERQGKQLLKELREGTRKLSTSGPSHEEQRTEAERRARNRAIEAMLEVLEERAKEDDEE